MKILIEDLKLAIDNGLLSKEEAHAILVQWFAKADYKLPDPIVPVEPTIQPAEQPAQ